MKALIILAQHLKGIGNVADEIHFVHKFRAYSLPKKFRAVDYIWLACKNVLNLLQFRNLAGIVLVGRLEDIGNGVRQKSDIVADTGKLAINVLPRM